MSLMSLLNASSSQTNASQSYGSSALTIAAQKAIGEAKAAAAASAGSTKAPTDDATVVISPAATAAAIAKADNAKDFTALSKEVRSGLDLQYAAKPAAGEKTTAPDLSKLSGRAVAAISLNKTGSFSRSEISAAKAELKDRSRQDFLSSTAASGTGLAGLLTYSKQMVSQYDATSSEEREARGWTTQTRASSANFVQKASTPSLWDLMG